MHNVVDIGSGFSVAWTANERGGKAFAQADVSRLDTGEQVDRIQVGPCPTAQFARLLVLSEARWRVDNELGAQRQLRARAAS